MLVPVTPINPRKENLSPLPFRNYVIPTRSELDVLEIIWTKENVQDTTIYSCLDTTLNIMMIELNQLLERMTRKGFVSRKIVSPRNEFNAFGVLIEMSSTNRRNRVYEYKTLVDRDLMRSFIDANAFLFKQDSSIVNHRRLEAARNDSTLLKDLNKKIQQVQK
jgi:predicted transcriptional regulator